MAQRKFFIEYIGDGRVKLQGIGLFDKKTEIKSVDELTAVSLRNDPNWKVTTINESGVEVILESIPQENQESNSANSETPTESQATPPDSSKTEAQPEPPTA